MAAYKTYKFKDIFELELHLNGGLMGCNIQNGIRDLQGKTVIFTAPAGATCTFGAPSNGAYHTLQEIKTALEAAIAGLAVAQKDGKLTLKGSTGVTITGGTANKLLGFGAAASAKVYNAPGGAAPVFVSSFADPGSLYLVVME